MKKYWFSLAIILISIFSFSIRLYKVTESPPAPYWEEVALGYDAYSILKTGKDHHGNPWPVVAFESFGDWKPTGYFYALVPFIAIFDLSVLAIRLPSVFAGTGIVFGLGWIIWLGQII
jgi:4-amino-4-deoxy-L-arabinose transferase-like glycosyltransferase